MLTVRECSSMKMRRIQGAGPALPGAGMQVIVPATAGAAVAAAKKMGGMNRMNWTFMLCTVSGSVGLRGSVDIEDPVRTLQPHRHLRLAAALF